MLIFSEFIEWNLTKQNAAERIYVVKKENACGVGRKGCETRSMLHCWKWHVTLIIRCAIWVIFTCLRGSQWIICWIYYWKKAVTCFFLCPGWLRCSSISAYKSATPHWFQTLSLHFFFLLIMSDNVAHALSGTLPIPYHIETLSLSHILILSR